MNTLAEYELNGREIESTIKTAHLLASGNGERTGFSHVKTVLSITRGDRLDRHSEEVLGIGMLRV